MEYSSEILSGGINKMVGTENKPRCRLPEVFSHSYIIGSTVHALKEAGLYDKACEFTRELSENNAISDYNQILKIASRYVEFM